MRCFIHLDVEAISVCKKCGKAMCVECSAYSGHSGICPECRREEFIKERESINNELDHLRSKMIMSIVFAVLFAIAAIALGITEPLWFTILIVSGIFVIRALLTVNKRKPLENRLAYLDGEIHKLGRALNKGIGLI